MVRLWRLRLLGYCSDSVDCSQDEGLRTQKCPANPEEGAANKQWKASQNPINSVARGPPQKGKGSGGPSKGVLLVTKPCLPHLQQHSQKAYH
uniref:Uncharacterized protein n=1 Tax=Globodera rostochiensis TaxID=31243 RepID=A0A914H208_GLORO